MMQSLVPVEYFNQFVEANEALQRELFDSRGQNKSFNAAHVRLILAKKEDEKTIVELRRLLEEEQAKNRVSQDRARGTTSELVKYIRGSAQWAAKVNELTSENQRLREEKEVVKTEVSALKKTLTEEQQNVVVLKSKLADKERETRVVEEDLKNKEGFIKVQDVLLKSLKVECVSAKEKVEQFSSVMKKQDVQLEKLRGDCMSLNKNIKQVNFDMEELSVDREEKKNTIKNQSIQIKSLRMDFLKLQKDLDKKNLEILLQKDEVYKLQGRLDNFQTNYKKMLDEAANDSRIKTNLLEFEINKLIMDIEYSNDKNIELSHKLENEQQKSKGCIRRCFKFW